MKWKKCNKHIAALLCLLSFLGLLVFQVNEAWQVVLYLPDNANPSEVQGDFYTSGMHPGPFPYHYIIRESDKCPEGKPPPFLVLLIHSASVEVEARNAIRKTWGNESLVPGLGIVRLFLMGVKEGKLGRLQQKAIVAESTRHRDIIQQDFLDTYYNLTLKTLMGMNWVAMHCPQASYVMKTDSDMLVNTVYLIHELLRPELRPKTSYFTGCIHRAGPVVRDKGSKWYMSREEYPSERYPDYCSGSGYVFSGDMATEVYRESLGIPLMRFEDVYVGVCLDRLGVKPTPPPRGLFNPSGLSYSRSRYRNMVTVHRFHPGQLLEYWQNMWSDAVSDTVLSSHGMEADCFTL